MLIIDDRLTFRVLTGSYEWLPKGFARNDLATTVSFHYRLLSAMFQPSPRGVHSHAFHDLNSEDQQVVRARAESPDPVLTVLDPRPSLFTAAILSATSRRLSHLQAELAAAAVTLDAPVALSTASQSLLDLCATYGIEVHAIKLD